MKKYFLIIAILLAKQHLYGQPGENIRNMDDPFCQMVENIYHINALGFYAQFNEKAIFETDTVTASAKVLVKKNGNIITYLQIIPEEGEHELLFYGDSAWVVDHDAEKMDLIGTSLDEMGYNWMSNYFSFTIFTLDTLISQAEPFWKVIEKNKEFTTISLDIEDQNKDLSGTRVEFTIGNSDHLLYKTYQESVYMNADKFFQEQVFSNYTFLDSGLVKIPEYFSIYGKDLGNFRVNVHGQSASTGNQAVEIYLENIELVDFAGNPIHLPGEGLILFDLWYVGCAPCMKSAPVMDKLYRTFKDRLYFFSVNEVDRDTAKIASFKQKMGITFPVLLGVNDKIGPKVTGDEGYPVFFLMDAESGKVLWSLDGYTDSLEEVITVAIKENL